MPETVGKVEITLAPTLVSILEALGTFSQELQRITPDAALLASWERCVTTIMRNVEVAPVEPSQAEMN